MDEESKLNVIDIDDWKFIPNKMFDIGILMSGLYRIILIKPFLKRIIE